MSTWSNDTAGRQILEIAREQAGLVNRRQALSSGISDYRIMRLTKVGAWHRVTTGVYNVAPNAPWKDPIDAARVQAAWTGLLTVPDGISTGACALALHGIWGLPMKVAPEVALPNGQHRYGSVGVRVRRYQAFATTRLRGRLVATPVHALAQALPELSREQGVAVIDSAINRKKIALTAVAEIERLLRGRRGTSRVRPWLALVDGLAESPFETRVRLQCLDAGLPRPTLQAEVWDEERKRIARGDLGWQRPDGTWVLVDLDGKRYHEDPEALFVDRLRQNAIALNGRHTHLRFAWPDLRAGVIPREIARALHAV